MVTGEGRLVLHPVRLHRMRRPQDGNRPGSLERIADPGAEPLAAGDQPVPPHAITGALDDADDGLGGFLIGAGIADEDIVLVARRHAPVLTLVHARAPGTASD